MNYEFHVGDYVENRKGDVGWVTSVTDEKIVWETNNGKTYVMEVPTLNRVQHPEALFVRIGAYDFHKKEKKKIEQLQKDLPVEMKVGNKVAIMKQYFDGNYNTIIYSTKMIDKINELVDAVNKLMDKEDKE
jgi:hypothetical protein